MDVIGGVPTTRNYSFIFYRPTTIIGGFKGFSASGSGSIDPNAPDGKPSNTILTGDHASTPGNPFDNSHHVFHVDGQTGSEYADWPVTIKRLNIRDGNAYFTPIGAPFSSKVGAGIYCRDAVLEISKINISDCWTDNSGAAVFVCDGALRARICVLRNNVARGNGAGIMLRTPHTVPSEQPDGWNRLSQLHNVQFLDNIAEGGAGFTAQGPFPSWADSFAAHPGLSVSNCLFARNKGLFGGGAHLVLLGDSAENWVHWNNCTFTENEATGAPSTPFPFAGSGGGLLVSDQVSGPIDDFLLHNSILKFNKGTGTGGTPTDSNFNIYSASHSLAPGSISHCDIGPHVAGWSFNPVWATTFQNVIDEDPLFANAGMGNFHLSALSPCINQGNDYLLSRDYMDLDDDGLRILEQVPLDLDRYFGNANTRVREYNFLSPVGATGITGVDAGNVSGAITDLGCFEKKPQIQSTNPQ